MSLAWLKDFVKANPEITNDKLTTSQVVMKIVKPRTADHECRFTQLMLEDKGQAHAVSQGRPYYFVSHAWRCPFEETVSMVARHFHPRQQKLWRRRLEDEQPLPPLDDTEVFVWFDIFAVVRKKNIVYSNTGLNDIFRLDLHVAAWADQVLHNPFPLAAPSLYPINMHMMEMCVLISAKE